MVSLFDNGPFEPCPSPFNMAEYVLTNSGADPKKIALEIAGKNDADQWTYGALRQAVLGTAGALKAKGMEAQDRLLIRLGNTVDFPILYLAAIAIDVVPLPVSAQLTAPEIDRIMTDIAPKLIALDASLAMPKVDPALVVSADALTGMRDHAPADFARGDPERLAYMLYTSGTSGAPRAVCHAHRAIWARRMMWRDWYDLRASDRMMHAGAFNWSYTLGTGLMDPWAIGATAVIAAQGTSAADLPAMMARLRATIFAAAPGVYRRMTRDQPARSFPDLRHGLSAGEKLPDAIGDAWTAMTGKAVYEAYGMSECSTFISSSPAKPAGNGASGYPQTGRRIAIVDDAGPVPFGQDGTIAVSRDDIGLMLGYAGNRDETDERFQGDWFITGDRAVMAPDYAVTYLGRADDMMNAGGLRVSPIEVEAVLNTCPGVIETAAVEVHVKEDTAVICAFFCAEDDVHEHTLQVFAQSRLAAYKVPRMYVRTDALPKGANGKLLRRELRSKYEADNGKT